MNTKEETTSHKTSDTVSCKSYHSESSRKGSGGGASFLDLCMNIGTYQQRRTVSEPAEDSRLLQRCSSIQIPNSSGAINDNETIAALPGTPKKDRITKRASERQNLQLPDQDKGQIRQLSPLMVDTSMDMTYAQRNQQHSYPYVDYPELKSPGIFLPMDGNIDARKKEKIFRAISQVLSQEEDEDDGSSTKSNVRNPEPFALQDPSSFRLKRQISTESNDSSDIKFSNKSPVKRMQSMPSSSSSVKASPRLDRQSSTKSDKSKDDVIKCKPYANNLQWIVPKDGPSCEKDFVEASHMRKSNTFPSDLSYSNKSTDENSRRQSDTSMNRDMVSGFLSRRGDTFGTGTTHSSKNPMVSEKGFFFPPPPQTFEPVMFSPRVVVNSFKPVFSANDTNPIRSNQACGTNIERYGSLDSMQCEKHSSNAVSDESNFENNLVSAFFRKRALRSNSDIPRSPSKQEIEEVRELIRKYHRSLSDPSFISPQKKAMLYEEKMINDLHTRDDVFEDPTTTSTPKYSDHRSMTPRTTSSSLECKDEIVRELLEHNHRMRKELVKRRLYQECEDLRSPFTGTDWQYDENITEVSRSVDIAGLLVGELQRRTSDRKRHSTIPEDPEMAMLDRVDGGSNKSSPGNRDRFHENERLPQPPKSPLPSTSMVSPPSQRTHGEPSRKRKRGEINLRMTCSCEDLAEKSRELTERLRDLDHSPGKNCKCANIENEILLMANDAYSKIRRSDDSKQAMRQYQEEVNETNLTIFDSMSILCSIKALCKHGRTLEDVYPGSVIFVIRCRTVSALDDLWRMYKSGEIDKLFTKDFLTLKMKRKYGVSNVRLRAEIKLEEYWKVRKELDDTCSVVTLDSSFSKSDTEIVRVGSASKENFHRRSSMKKASMSNIAIVHMRSQSAPQVNQPSPIQSPSWLLSPNSPLSRDRKFSFNLTPEEQSPRVVFQELNFGSPTLKKVFDFDIALSSKTSPKRKTFAEPPPWETDENMNSQEFASPKRKNFGTNLDRK